MQNPIKLPHPAPRPEPSPSPAPEPHPLPPPPRPIPQLPTPTAAGRHQESDRLACRHEDVCDRLLADPFVDAPDIDVRITDVEITLESVARLVISRAEDTTLSVSGVRDVHNLLRVEQR